jgi:acyl-CoA synthetase (AMP-forming)/AMP-acid ligase II
MSAATDFAVERLTRTTGSPAAGDRIAIVDGARRVTFDDVDRATDQVANGLRHLGLRPGDRVAFVGRNCLACVELMLGAARAGAVMTIVNWRLHPQELAYLVSDIRPALIVTTAELADTVGELPEVAGATVLVVDGGGPNDWDTWRAAQSHDPSEEVQHADHEVMLHLYTSGTTGKPKGAMLTRRSLAACIPDTVAVWQLDPSSVVLAVLPMFHIAGAGTVVGALWSRACLVIDNDPSPGNMAQVIASERVTNLILASVMLQGLVESAASATTDLSSIRTISYGAAPIAAEVLRAARDVLGCRLVQAYGLTETAGVLCILSAEDHAFDSRSDAVALSRLRSCGRARPGVELRIVDIRTGDVLGPGQLGEVQARSGRLMQGYWQKPQATADVLITDGWFRTGDVGELDADGYLFLRDRLKDTIISGGENIYPAEVENALQGHPDVVEVAVIGIPDERWGETPSAVVVCAAGSVLSSDDLIDFARGRLAHYKCPTSVTFVDVLPRNATGKVLRRALREPHWAGRERQIN